MHDSNVSGNVTVVEPTPFPHLSYVLGGIKFVGETPSRSECRVRTPLAMTALVSGLLKRSKKVDINHFRVSLAHAHAIVLKTTAKQHGIRLTGEMVSCLACFRAKWNRAPTPHHAARRVTQPLGLVSIDTAGSYLICLGGSCYVVIFVDSASPLQQPYGAREKSASAIFLS